MRQVLLFIIALGVAFFHNFVVLANTYEQYPSTITGEITPQQNGTNGNISVASDAFQTGLEVKTANSLDSGQNMNADVNNDGTVSIADVTMLIDMLLNSGSEIDMAADINQDGTASIADVTILIDLLLGTSPITVYSTILVTTIDGVIIEYLIDENTKLKIQKPHLVLETDGMVLTYPLEQIAQLRYGQQSVSNELGILQIPGLPTVGTVFLHNLKKNTLAEVIAADGRVVMSASDGDSFKASIGNEPSGEYMIKADSLTIKIVKL